MIGMPHSEGSARRGRPKHPAPIAPHLYGGKFANNNMSVENQILIALDCVGHANARVEEHKRRTELLFE